MTLIEYKLILCIIIGIVIGLTISSIALYMFRMNLVNKTGKCCAKCSNCIDKGGQFYCKEKQIELMHILYNGNDCNEYNGE